MAKAIQFIAGKLKFAAALTKIDRDKVYGFIEVKVNPTTGVHFINKFWHISRGTPFSLEVNCSITQPPVTKV